MNVKCVYSKCYVVNTFEEMLFISRPYENEILHHVTSFVQLMMQPDGYGDPIICCECRLNAIRVLGSTEKRSTDQ